MKSYTYYNPQTSDHFTHDESYRIIGKGIESMWVVVLICGNISINLEFILAVEDWILNNRND